MTDRRTVFLSASIPIDSREPFYSINRSNIREAILALVLVCYERDLDLVLAGNPAITPLVHHAAVSLGYVSGTRSLEKPDCGRPSEVGFASQNDSSRNVRKDRKDCKIIVYQSMYFQKLFSVSEFWNAHPCNVKLIAALPEFPIPAAPKDIDQQALFSNVSAMRDCMINKFEGHYCCGVFIAGTEGLLDEFARFRSTFPNAPCFPLTSTGGATAFGLPTSSDSVLLSAILPPNPNPPQVPLLAQVRESRSASDEQINLLVLDAECRLDVTYRTVFRKLLGTVSAK